MRYSYDFEFHERDNTYPVEAISVGVQSEDGRSYYAVFKDFDFAAATHNKFLGDFVIPHLPLIDDGEGSQLQLDYGDRDVKSREQIRTELEQFFQLDPRAFSDAPKAELWGYFADYDHVCLAQVWGTMVQMPRGLPWFTKDIKQEMDRAGIKRSDLPLGVGVEHHALDDARTQMLMLKELISKGVVK